MPEETKKILVAWLNDAYAMEQAQTEMLGRVIKDFGTHEEIQIKLTEHLEQTKEQQQQVKTCIESLGESVSNTKSVLGGMIGAVQGISTSPYKDEMVKDMIMIHAGEHFEHACYLALTAAAQSLGEDQIAKTCAAIAEQEKSMAEWSEQFLPAVVDTALGFENATP